MLKPGGTCIPYAYESHVQLVCARAMHSAVLSIHYGADAPYVGNLCAGVPLSAVQCAWCYSHLQSETAQGFSERYADLHFEHSANGVVHGPAGYFTCSPTALFASQWSCAHALSG